MWVLGVIVILFGIYNMFSYLYKLEKYKSPTNVALYVASLSSIGLNIAFAQLTPINDYCNLQWYFTAYLAAYCNLVVGVCQAYLFSSLKNQLTCLFNFQAALGIRSIRNPSHD